MINPSQFRVLKNKSTTQQLILFLSNIFNSRHQLDVIYLDINNAFDTVSHSLLLSKLLSFNIGGEIWSWFCRKAENSWQRIVKCHWACITNRYQYVSINNSNSCLLLVESGVPQGSILRPLLFIMCMNDLPDTVVFSKVFCRRYKMFSTHMHCQWL